MPLVIEIFAPCDIGQSIAHTKPNTWVRGSMQSKLSVSLQGHFACPFHALAHKDDEVSTTAFEEFVVPDVKNRILPSSFEGSNRTYGCGLRRDACREVNSSVNSVSTSVASV